ncbi:hypothetical protein [Actinomadura atramentaria]|uniref:hypothetical protein n=1 Tax=Actinomadura atramentaria TaxID=1990 RepID=UPI000380D56D|nr:hypothetical protein [Actinomadura atramentaria]
MTAAHPIERNPFIMLVKALASVLAAGLLTLGPAGAAAAASSPRDVNIHAFNFTNSGEDAGNDSWLEVDRSLNLAKGDGSPGSDIINRTTGSAPVMSPGK